MTEAPIPFLGPQDHSLRPGPSAYDEFVRFVAQASPQHGEVCEGSVESPQGLGVYGSPLAFAEALGLAVFLCERDGTVLANTRQAFLVAKEGALVKVERGRLRAACSSSDKLLFQAIRAAAPTKALPTASIIILRTSCGLPQRTDIMPAPGSRDGHALALVSIGIGLAINESDLAMMAGLTASEAAVAGLASRGLTVPQIALERQVAVPTIKSQLKAAYMKLGVSRRAELISLFNGARRPPRMELDNPSQIAASHSHR